MKLHVSTLRLQTLLLVPVFALLVCAPRTQAQSLGVATLAGPWQATLLWSGSGCGAQSAVVNFTLDATGTTNSATVTYHSQLSYPVTPTACGDRTETDQTFQITSLNPNGSGTAFLSCNDFGVGVPCGFILTIQVDLLRLSFNIADIAPANPGNFVVGTAIRQTPPLLIP